MDTTELNNIVNEALSKALQPIMQKLESLKSQENDKTPTTTELSQNDEPDWSNWDKIAKQNGYIN